MTKQIVFIISIICSIMLIIVLFFLKFGNKKEILIETKENEIKEVEVPNSSLSSTEKENDKDENTLIKLANDETYISSIETDLNEDGFMDELIAVKKTLYPSIYLIIEIKESQTEAYKKSLEIKTNVLATNSLLFYTIQLQKSLPAIVVSGLGLNGEQTFAIYLIKQDSKSNIFFETLASLNADIQVQLEDKRNSTIGSLEDYSIHTYNFENKEENSMNQIHSEYRWDVTSNTFIKINEEKIAGSKFENPILKELKRGTLEAYKKYLSAVWFTPKTLGENIRYIYYDKDNNNFIFHIGEIEEIYKIQNMFARRLGISIIANNTSISSIKRHIEIEVKSIEEIQVKVIEDVATLKIGVSSNWSGIYRKKQNVFTSSIQAERQEFTELKKLFFDSKITWIHERGFLKTRGSSYVLKYDDKEEKGIFNIIMIDDKYVMQTKSNTNEKSFYIIELSQNEKQEANISLNDDAFIKLKPATLEFSKIKEKDSEELILRELK